MAKRATASALLQAGRRKPPAVSPPEQPIIPPGPLADDTVARQHDDWSTSELANPASSELIDQSTEIPVNTSTSKPSDLTTSSPRDESPSSLDNSLTEYAAPANQGTSELDHSVTDLVADGLSTAVAVPADGNIKAKSTSGLVLLATALPEVEADRDDVTGGLVSESPSSLVAMSTSELPSKLTSSPDDLLLGKPVAELTSPLSEHSTSTPVDLSPSPPDLEHTASQRGSEASRHAEGSSPYADLASELKGDEVLQSQENTATPFAAPPPQVVARSGQTAKRRDPAPFVDRTASSRIAAVGAATSSPVTEATGRYQRLTVFLTPAQRQWLKRTGRQMPVEGLSVSDIVRLAVNRLSADVNAGLPLVDELTSQAYGEAETMTGRRNRGLPPV